MRLPTLATFAAGAAVALGLSHLIEAAAADASVPETTAGQVECRSKADRLSISAVPTASGIDYRY
jgi:hypothetical protein